MRTTGAKSTEESVGNQQQLYISNQGKVNLNTVQYQQIAVINPDLTYDYNQLKIEDNVKQLQQLLMNASFISTSITNSDKLYGIKGKNILKHKLLQMVHYAYECHYPLSFSPDNIQLLINQGVSAHIIQNAEKFRGKFVQHEGKKEIRVVDLVSSIEQIDWPKTIEKICLQIRNNIGEERYKLCVHNFSTTDDIAHICYSVNLMDTMKNYFLYRIFGCGISKVKLFGTLEDWIKIRKNVEYLREFELDWWIDKLIPILDQFIKLYQGEIDTKFWGDIYKYQQHQFYDPTPTHVTGWITYFFPYQGSDESDDLFIKSEFSDKDQKYLKIRPKKIPGGVSIAPAEILLDGQPKVTVQLTAGFFGVGMDEDGFLNVKQGWATAVQD